ILTNFALQERLVFHDLRHEGKSFWLRFLMSVSYNGADAALRLPVLYLIVEFTPIPSVIAQGITLVVAFIVRFLFHSRVVYRPQPTARRGATAWVDGGVTLGENEQSREG